MSGAVLIALGGSADAEIATPKLPTEVWKVTTLSKRCSKSPDEPGGVN
jgi:hypothetical protein